MCTVTRELLSNLGVQLIIDFFFFLNMGAWRSLCEGFKRRAGRVRDVGGEGRDVERQEGRKQGGTH